jgi:nucleotide-binding universal stress UspA family protein
VKRILVPVDFSDRSLGILSHAQAIAGRYDAELTLLHVVNPVYSIPAVGPFGPAVLSVPRSVFDDANQRLDAFGVDRLQPSRVRKLIYEGDPAEQIIEFANSEQVELIVLSTHGLGPLRRFLIGSVTAKVLHDAHCPVLTGAHLNPHPESKPVQFAKILCAIDSGPNSERALAWAVQFAADFEARLEVVHVAGDGIPKPPGIGAADFHILEGEVAKAVCAFASASGSDLLVIGRGDQDDSAGRLRTNAYAMIGQSPCPVVSV